jgi:hypothetical protein
VEAAGASTAVIAAEAPTAVEAAATAVKTSTTTAAVTATLGENGRRHTDQRDRRDSCEKSFQQGGFLHINPLPPDNGLAAREGNPPLLILLYSDSHPGSEVAQVSWKSGFQASHGSPRISRMHKSTRPFLINPMRLSFGRGGSCRRR